MIYCQTSNSYFAKNKMKKKKKKEEIQIIDQGQILLAQSYHHQSIWFLLMHIKGELFEDYA
jgi:hypothetical protein